MSGSVNQVLTYSVTGTDAVNFNLVGGIYGVTLTSGAWGTVTLNALAADETTWVPFQSWDGDAAATLTLVAGSYQFAYDSVDTAVLGLVQQPPTPNWRLQALTQPLPINANGGATNYQTLTGYDSITLETPNSSGVTGDITIKTGNSSGDDSGNIFVQTGNADGTRGSLTLNADAISAPSGFVLDSGAAPISFTVSTQTADNGAGANIEIAAGPGGGTSGAGGNIHLISGVGTNGASGGAGIETNAATGNTGGAYIGTSDSSGGKSGDVSFYTGNSGGASTAAGDIQFYLGHGTGARDGLVIISTLPTADPHVAGALWNSTGNVKVSAGP